MEPPVSHQFHLSNCASLLILLHSPHLHSSAVWSSSFFHLRFFSFVVFIIILPWEAMSRIQEDCVNLHQAFRGSFFFSFSVLKISQMFDSFHFSMFSDILDFPYVHNRNVVCAKRKNRKICLAETPNSLQCQTCPLVPMLRMSLSILIYFEI